MSQSTQNPLPYKYETNVWKSVHPNLTAIKIRDKCMAVSPLKPYSHTTIRRMHGIQSTQASLPYICLLFSGSSSVCYIAGVCPKFLKVGCVTNVDKVFLVMRFISLIDEIKFLLI